MDPVSVLLLLCTGVALHAAGLHLFLHLWLRRGEREHLWLGVTALGVAAISVCNLRIYHSAGVQEAEAWQRVMFVASTPVMVGFLRFSLAFLRERRPWLDRAALAFALLVALLSLGTDAVFSGEPVVRDLGELGPAFTESALDGVGRSVVAVFMLFFASAVALYVRRLRRADAEIRLVGATLLAWFATGLNDAAVVSGLYQAPYLMSIGYIAIIVGVSHVLVRRFARSLEEVQQLAALLRDRMPDRDLALSRGERSIGIGTLAASVAHEINNPLAFVQSNLNRLEELWSRTEGKDASPEERVSDAREVEEILSELREGAERVGQIVSELLLLARDEEP